GLPAEVGRGRNVAFKLERVGRVIRAGRSHEYHKVCRIVAILDIRSAQRLVLQGLGECRRTSQGQRAADGGHLSRDSGLHAPSSQGTEVPATRCVCEGWKSTIELARAHPPLSK